MSATLSRRRIVAITRKELWTYRRSRTTVLSMSVIALVFMIQPLITVFVTPASTLALLRRSHELLYMLAIPALVPATLAAYAIVGERQQGTLEPILTTPLRREELVLGKALAVLLPSIAISYLVYAVFLLAVVSFGPTGASSDLIHGSDVLAQVVFTPLLAGWSVWLGMALSTRAPEIRVAQQLSVLASLPSIAVTTLLSVHVIHPSTRLAVGFAVLLIVANRLGWRMVTALFDRERLITSTTGAGPPA